MLRSLNRGEAEDTRQYKVVVNHEEQYSIWFGDREPPWAREMSVSSVRPKAECLADIKEVWTDMRPLSLRRKWKKRRRIENKNSPLRTLFEKPTIEQFAEVILERLLVNKYKGHLESVLGEIEALSDDAARSAVGDKRTLAPA